MTTKRRPPVDPDSIIYTPGTGSWVPSGSHPGAFYLVEWDSRSGVLTCTCPAGERAAEYGPRARACRHMIGEVERVKRENARHRRPVVPPNVSALVD